MSKSADSRYCSDCKRKHHAAKWYGDDSFWFCHRVYRSMERAGWTVLHPSWSVFYNAMTDIDATGSRIAAAQYRMDVNAVSDAYVLFAMYPQWESLKLFLVLLAAQMYFPWPMHEFVHSIGRKSCGILSRDLLLKIGDEIFTRYSSMRVLNGRLVYGTSKGFDCTTNPSERKNGSVRYHLMVEDLRGCMCLCSLVEDYFSKNNNVSISAMLKILGDSKCVVFDGKKQYKNVRCCRLFASAAGKVFVSDAIDWEVFATMSRHVSGVIDTLGLREYKRAAKYVEALGRELSIPSYSINDFIIFVCLLTKIYFDP